MYVISPDERQSEKSAWVPMLLGTCEAELEEASVHGREEQLTRRQLLKRSHLQPGIPDDDVQVKTHH